MNRAEQRTVLVVEDDYYDRELLTNQLIKAKIEEQIVFVGNGNEALDFLLQAFPPPIAIFLDLHLPGLSGGELLQKIRQDDRLKAIPVIVMTGFNDPYDLQKCKELKVTTTLKKPINFATFSNSIADLFKKSL